MEQAVLLLPVLPPVLQGSQRQARQLESSTQCRHQQQLFCRGKRRRRQCRTLHASQALWGARQRREPEVG